MQNVCSWGWKAVCALEEEEGRKKLVKLSPTKERMKEQGEGPNNEMHYSSSAKSTSHWRQLLSTSKRLTKLMNILFSSLTLLSVFSFFLSFLSLSLSLSFHPYPLVLFCCGGEIRSQEQATNNKGSLCWRPTGPSELPNWIFLITAFSPSFFFSLFLPLSSCLQWKVTATIWRGRGNTKLNRGMHLR